MGIQGLGIALEVAGRKVSRPASPSTSEKWDSTGSSMGAHCSCRNDMSNGCHSWAAYTVPHRHPHRKWCQPNLPMRKQPPVGARQFACGHTASEWGAQWGN